jgi:heat shock protein HtpX
MEDDSPNAFAVGRDPKKAAVAITSGLLARLDRDELQGVMAHEVAHIKNLDVRFLTIATVMVGSIVILSNFYLRAMFYGAGRRRSGKGGGNNAIMIVGIVAAILAPIAARMLYFACSRSREYLADASAARFTRYPPGLASALEKISGQSVEGKQVNQALAPLYIINPLQAHSAQVSNLFSTHPPAARRIKILRSMAGGAGYADYETAFRKVEGAGARCLGAATLTSKEGKRIAAREASEESATDKAANKSAGKKEAVERVREVTDMLDRMAEMVFIGCACGVRIKTPPEYKKETIDCPRCGRSHTIPHAEVQEMMAVGEIIRSSGALGHDKDSEGSSILDLGATTQSETKPSLPPLRYRRTGAGWESFKCSCDKTIQLSPGFRGSAMLCSKCKRQIEIIAAEEQPA